MKEDLYNNIERFNNGEMEPDESAAFRQQMNSDQDLAEEVWIHQRLEEELGDSKKLALRETLGQLGDSFVPAVPRRIGLGPWLPVIISGAAAAVALYLLVRTPSLQSVPSPHEIIVDTPHQPNDKIASNLIPSEIPAEFIELEQNRLRLKLGQKLLNDALEDQLNQSAQGFTFDFQIEEEQVIEPSVDDKAYIIHGKISGAALSEHTEMAVELFNSQQSLGLQPLTAQWNSNATVPTIDFHFTIKTPEQIGWCYYQIKTDKDKVLYTGKLGFYWAD